MTTQRLVSVTTVVLVLFLTGCAAKLPLSAEQLLVRRLGATSLFAVNELKYRTVEGSDYLGVFANFEITSGFESLYHPVIVLRKKHSEVEWSNADLFSIGSKSLASVFQLPEPEFKAALHPLKNE